MIYIVQSDARKIPRELKVLRACLRAEPPRPPFVPSVFHARGCSQYWPKVLGVHVSVTG